MPDPSISDDDVLRVTRSFLERMDRQPPPRDIEGDVMKVILTPRRTRWIPSARLVASGLMVAAVVAVGCVALVLPVDRLSSPSPSTAGASPHWSIVPSPTPSGTPYGQLVNVACPSASDCWAVGDLEKGRNDVSLLERYTDGGWSIVASPIPSGATSSGLGGVTCRVPLTAGRSAPTPVPGATLRRWLSRTRATAGPSSPAPIRRVRRTRRPTTRREGR
jgi:hypothetical protein